MNRIKFLRKDFGLTLRKLSELLDVNYSFISRVELGKQQLKDSDLCKIANFFQVTNDYLLGLSDDGIICQCTNEEGKTFYPTISDEEYHKYGYSIAITEPDYKRIIDYKTLKLIDLEREQKGALKFFNIFSSLMQTTDDPKSERIAKAIPTLEDFQKDLIINLLDSWGK